MAALSAGNVALIIAYLDRKFEANRRNSTDMDSSTWAALQLLYTASGITTS